MSPERAIFSLVLRNKNQRKRALDALKFPEKFVLGAHKVTVVEPDVLHGLYQLLSNYDTYRDSLEGLKQTLRNLIKPDSVLSNSFI